MANYATLKSAIQQVVRTNGTNAITGALLQQVLFSMVNSLGADYQFVGVATTETTPGTPDNNVAYLAGPGVYSNFGGIVVPSGILGIMKYNGSWTFEKIFGLSDSSVVVDSQLVAGDRSFYNGLVSANFYNAQDSRDAYIRIFGYFTNPNRVQLTITKDKSTFIDFNFSVDAAQTGIKTYYKHQGNDFIKITVNWDGLSNLNNGNYAFKLENRAFTETEIYALQTKILGESLFESEETYTTGRNIRVSVADGSVVAISMVCESSFSVNILYGVGTYQLLGTIDEENPVLIFKTPSSGQNRFVIAYPGGDSTKIINIAAYKIDPVNPFYNGILAINNRIKELDAMDVIIRSQLCGLAQVPTTNVSILNFLKSLCFYDSSNTDINKKYTIRHIGYFNGNVQVTVGDNGVYTDFTFTDNDRTGTKIYEKAVGSMYLRFTVDWDAANTSYLAASDILIYSNIFESDIIPAAGVTVEKIGDTGGTYSLQAVNNSVVCPVRAASSAAQIKNISLTSENAGNVILYVGDVDQYYLFIVRNQFVIPVSAGAQTIDVSDMGIYVFGGERVAIKFNGGRYLRTFPGAPDGPNSFYYSQDNMVETNPLQLQVFGNATRSIAFAFQVEVHESEMSALAAQVENNTSEIQNLLSDVAALKGSQNIIPDRSGNKYRLMVVDGNVAAFALDFSHILCVGNSYTIHPTVDDTEPDYANNLWWGHWAMAASSKNTAWTTLLQSIIRQKKPSAKVTPVFGRRYETGAYSLTDNGTFTYWENDAWQNLRPNVSAFSDVDCVLFFLGDNYTGTDWYAPYKAMVEQFVAWFPNATIVCCSTRVRPANNEAITQVANEISAIKVDMYQLGGASKLGNYVYGDDNLLHQINVGAVASHFGDYGQYLILNRIAPAIGYENNVTLRNITLVNKTGVVLSVKDLSTIPGSVVSVFATIEDGVTLNSVSATTGGNALSVTDHGVTDYGRIFTFIMPNGDVTVTAN